MPDRPDTDDHREDRRDERNERRDQKPAPPVPEPPPLEPPAPLPPPMIAPKLQGRAFVDERGPRPLLGASLFWLAWGTRHEPVRTSQHLQWLSDRGVDFVRALAEVGGSTWEDRVVDPRWADYREVIRTSTEHAMNRGMRVAWTLFGGGCLTTDDEWWMATSQFCAALSQVKAGIQYIEIRNEQNGPPVPLARLLAEYVRSALGCEVAIQGTPEADLPDVYGGSKATLATVHFDRADGDWGWRPMRQAWGYWELADMPPAFVSGEPIGIDSSVRPENDPVKLATDALCTWIAGGAAYVLHHGAGIRGGGAADLARGRQRDAWDQPMLSPALCMIAALRDSLPVDLPNWARAGNYWSAPNPEPPFRADPMGDEALSVGYGCIRHYAAVHGKRFVSLVMGISNTVALRPTGPYEAVARNIATNVEYAWLHGTPWRCSESDAGRALLVIGERT